MGEGDFDVGGKSGVTAAMVIIGNEILSGRTVDANLPYLAKALAKAGIRLAEARIVADLEDEIVEAVNALRAKHDYVFTTGGIGPTHDDITAAAIARAVGVGYGRHPEAERRLLAYYPPEKVNPARMKMADMPEGAELIDNPVSAAPGFRIDNVFVMAGVPKIMQAMLDGVLPALKGGATVLARSITVFAAEGEIAADLGRIQADHPELEIGSYPFHRPVGTTAWGGGTTIVFRGTDGAMIERAAAALLRRAAEMGITTEEAQPA